MDFLKFLNHVDRLNFAELRQLEIRIGIRRQRMACNCELASKPKGSVPWELHNENCAFYLAAMAYEEYRERERTLTRAIFEDR